MNFRFPETRSKSTGRMEKVGARSFLRTVAPVSRLRVERDGKNGKFSPRSPGTSRINERTTISNGFTVRSIIAAHGIRLPREFPAGTNGFRECRVSPYAGARRLAEGKSRARTTNRFVVVTRRVRKRAAKFPRGAIFRRRVGDSAVVARRGFERRTSGTRRRQTESPLVTVTRGTRARQLPGALIHPVCRLLRRRQ